MDRRQLLTASLMDYLLPTAAEVPWIEFFMDGVALNDELMQDDGIHPNAEAQPVLLDNAWPAISSALEAGRRTEHAASQ